ncbi:hypothetical protein RRG08_052097 [Elysia crispata]|uniref:BPTI/Kunitz inhibitor domain-containing protein n=1 Tax=Elysia crispata TaxID=231223 RepID=A0AAE1DS26_9GAST|nr:hypothetical protein RRG08_052097 [Elysia crispata]
MPSLIINFGRPFPDLGIECPPAAAPERGYLEGEGERVGAIVYVRCVRGYRLHGPTVMACRPSGERTARWSPDVPRECRVDDDEGSDEGNNSDNPDSTGNSNYLDQAIIKSRGNPHFLQPDSQFWQAQKKRRGRLGLTEEEKTAERREEVESLPASCRLRPLAGPCRGAVRRYFFDPAAMECHQFVYGGCQGNSNNFQTIDECNKKCQTRE